MAAMVGGGIRARPGEASLAHNGVLFLDELPEFTPQVLDSLRQPLEIGETMIARANYRISYPVALPARRRDEPVPLRHGGRARPRLPARRRAASTTTRRAFPVRSSTGSTSGIEVPAVSATDLILPAPAEPSAAVAARVAAARAIQRERYAGAGHARRHDQRAVRAVGDRGDRRAGRGRRSALLREAAEAMKLSARGYHRVLKVARTLADLDGAETVGRIHLAEALSYRAVGERLAAAA